MAKSACRTFTDTEASKESHQLEFGAAMRPHCCQPDDQYVRIAELEGFDHREVMPRLKGDVAVT